MSPPVASGPGWFARPAAAGVTFSLGLVLLLALLPLWVRSPYALHLGILGFIYATVTASLRTLALSGQISMGHAAFMSIGAYGSAILSREAGLSPWLTMPLGAMAAMAVAVLVGFPFARLRSIYFSMVSLFFGMGVLSVYSIFGSTTGHINGLIGIPPLFATGRMPYYYLFLALAVLCLAVLWRIETCRIGTCFRAISQSHRVAESVGISELRFRVLALAVTCFVAGLMGAAYAHYSRVISYSMFDLTASVNLLVFMLVGGLSRFAGPIVGVAVLFLLPELMRGLKEYLPFLNAAIMLAVVFLMPGGLVGFAERAWAALRDRGLRRAGR